MKFKNRLHVEKFYEILSRMRHNDVYHLSAAYLMALADLVPESVFNFDNDCIIPEGLYAGWQSSSSRRATRLMYNLWDGCYRDLAADNAERTSCYYAVDEIMYDHEYFRWFIEAIRIRFEWIDYDDDEEELYG